MTADIVAAKVDDWVVANVMPQIERMFEQCFGPGWQNDARLHARMEAIVNDIREQVYALATASVAAEFGCNGRLQPVGTRH